ncbi:ribose/proton symporter RbsU [Apilactobacillus xinyiensis]|uniref:GRP family sugar transporter n=1 Tax=Apilactobacillus xinyiensis TaxID=2841032 RepID=A0ABT0I0I0_9LACO|nr:GRP family sugar transporter [Apilactobacillus xinyiensis]MCK8624298.1 GRP family sugar transporter [Apilactobacillus xinyiensis]MCL0319170.1 GRP family sugar transporter [Apilactobacillus xinyiensis]
MNSVALLIGLGPLIGWGIYPTVASKFGGRPTNQIFGSTLGTLIFAIVYMMISGLSIPTGMQFFLSLLSGAGWAFGQIMSFKAFRLVGSSRVMPITTALQLIVTALWGVFVLGNWPGITFKIIGFLALIVIIIGATMTAWEENGSEDSSANLKKAVILLVIGVVGYWGYSAAPQAAHIDGMHAFLPQAIGMVLVAVIYCAFDIKEHNVFTNPVSYKQIISGFFFAFAALTYLVSAQPNMNGLATGFVLSQTSVVLATLTGIYVLREKKTPKETVVTIIGLVLILISACVTVFLK